MLAVNQYAYKEYGTTAHQYKTTCNLQADSPYVPV